MTSSKNSLEPENGSPNGRDSGDESEDESEVLEESPCGRWQKRREEVTQRDVPGIDNAFLAMDTEEGVEVVWNEVHISEKKSSKAQLDKIKQVFDNLIQLEHANIVKFHKYWTDTKSDKPRVIFITEYMSSGSLKQFLKKTNRTNKTLKAWKRWCTQILSALSYLHSCEPAIVHGNLTTYTIFIQHNGLIKIESVAPDAIYSHVKTRKEEARNMHYIAPEYGGDCCGEYFYTLMAALEILGNGDSGGSFVSEEHIQKTLDSLEDPLQRDFIQKCLVKDPKGRPTSRELLFHAVLFEVHSLKLLATHQLVKSASQLPETMTDEALHTNIDPNTVIAVLVRSDSNQENQEFLASQATTVELEKLVEDVKNGVYPLTAFASLMYPLSNKPRPMTPEQAESVKSETPEPADNEARLVVQMSCDVRKHEDSSVLNMTVILRMDDKMNRQLTCELTEEDTSGNLADELVHYGFISANDRDKLATLIEEKLASRNYTTGSPQQQLIAQTA